MEMFSDLGKKVKKNDTELGDIFGPWKKNRNGAWKNFRNLEKTAKKIKRNLERFLRTLEIKTELGKKELGNINRTWKFKPSLEI